MKSAIKSFHPEKVVGVLFLFCAKRAGSTSERVITINIKVTVVLNMYMLNLCSVNLRHRTYMSSRFTQISTQEFPNMAECSFSLTLLKS
jgi:hypothetical protein